MQFTWTPTFVPNKIFVFGCGGTGSRVVPLIAQFVKSCPWVLDPEMVLVDFDEVEQKNLTRQNFIAQDVGKNKAAVLANRYSKAFGMNISCITSKIVSSNAINLKSREAYTNVRQKLLDNNGRNCLFILCVDSPEARREILNAISGMLSLSPENVIIDSGNENDFGQVVVSSTALGSVASSERDAYLDKGRCLIDSTPIAVKLANIPLDLGYFAEMKTISAGSCADLDQTMAINTLMAVNIFGIVQNIYYVKSIGFHRLNISMQHGCTPEYITLQHLSKIAQFIHDGDNTFVYKARQYLPGSGLAASLTMAKREQDKYLKLLAEMKTNAIVASPVEKNKSTGPANIEVEKLEELVTGPYSL